MFSEFILWTCFSGPVRKIRHWHSGQTNNQTKIYFCAMSPADAVEWMTKITSQFGAKARGSLVKHSPPNERKLIDLQSQQRGRKTISKQKQEEWFRHHVWCHGGCALSQMWCCGSSHVWSGMEHAREQHIGDWDCAATRGGLASPTSQAQLNQIRISFII